MPKALKLWPT